MFRDRGGRYVETMAVCYCRSEGCWGGEGEQLGLGEGEHRWDWWWRWGQLVVRDITGGMFGGVRVTGGGFCEFGCMGRLVFAKCVCLPKDEEQQGDTNYDC